jgi:riboflavin biosynthesis pyrimidine reductase
MRRVLPHPSGSSETVELLTAYALPEPRADRELPFVRVNMISSIDGAISIGGRSGALGGAGDRAVFMAVRTLADMIVVGAGTIRAEGYGPARLDDAAQAFRTQRGATLQPAIAAVTGAARFDYSTPFFTDAEVKPLIITTSARADSAQDEAGDLADVIGAGADAVDLRSALVALAQRGATNVLVEGGPGLNGDLARAGLVDELCLTLSPRIVGGDGPRLMAGPTLMPPLNAHVMHLLEEDGFLFARLALRD